MEDKMSRTLNLIAACALALAVCAAGRGQDTTSLGDLARQTQKDKLNKPAAKVITNEDMSSNSGGISAAFGKAPARATQPGASSKPDAAPAPGDALDRLESILDQLDTLDRATLISNILGGNTANFPGRARWEERMWAAKQAFVVQSRDVLQKSRQLIASADGLKGIQDPNDPRAKSMTAKLQELMQESQQANAAFQAVIAEGKDLAAQGDAH
jgi:hypothetical protein